jgi:rSAM/selenodomain-associated transferase 1
VKSAKVHPAIIVFAREPVAGRTKTRLIPAIGADASAALAHAFALDTLAKARAITDRLVIAGSCHGSAADSPYFRRLARRYDAELVDQGSGALGARMRRVLVPYLDDGALLIGTDIPSLPHQFLTRLMNLLRRFRVVLGPSLDGGYYAVAARGVLPDIFRGIRWGTANVFANTLRRLEAGSVGYGLGDAWYDVDCRDDLLMLLAELRLSDGRCPCPATARLLRRLGLLNRRR